MLHQYPRLDKKVVAVETRRLCDIDEVPEELWEILKTVTVDFTQEEILQEAEGRQRVYVGRKNIIYEGYEYKIRAEVFKYDDLKDLYPQTQGEVNFPVLILEQALQLGFTYQSKRYPRSGPALSRFFIIELIPV